MHRIDTVNARPNQNGAGKAGFNDNTDLAGQDATYLDPAHLNAIQEEVATVIEATGTPLEKGTNNQLWTALNSFFASNTALDEVDSRLSTAITTLAAAMQQAIINERNAERNRVWPVGKGRYTTHDGLNPADASHLGWGTWALDAEMAGRVAVGAGSITIDYSAAIDDAARPNVTRTFANGETGGEIDHQQTPNEMLTHKHSQDNVYNKFAALLIDVDADLVDGNASGGVFAAAQVAGSFDASYLQVADISPAQATKMTEQSIGNSEPFNIMQPYCVVSVWLRTG
jgi:hypothetical protein